MTYDNNFFVYLYDILQMYFNLFKIRTSIRSPVLIRFVKRVLSDNREAGVIFILISLLLLVFNFR